MVFALFCAKSRSLPNHVFQSLYYSPLFFLIFILSGECAVSLGSLNLLGNPTNARSKPVFEIFNTKLRIVQRTMEAHLDSKFSIHQYDRLLVGTF